MLFIGGGKVAERKILSLFSFSKPFIKIVAPQITKMLKNLFNDNKIEWEKETFVQKKEFLSFDYIFICTDKREINEEAADFFISFQKEINVCDSKEKSTFFMPAVTKFENAIIAVSTSGKEPAYAKNLKNKLIEMLSEKRLR